MGKRKKKLNQPTVVWGPNVTPRIRQLFEKISEEFDLPYMEISMLAWRAVSDNIDPIEANGEIFSFERPPLGDGDPWPPMVEWLSPRVPAPDARVNLLDAKREYKRDTGICMKIWEGKPSLDELVAICRNQWAWCEFWSVRHRSEKERADFQEQLDEMRPYREAAQASARRQLKARGIDVDAGGAVQ
jgi:hypothetical protein